MRAGSLLSYYYSRGSTLVEVLVATLVVSIGMLGVAAMHVSALEGANNAQYRSRATDLAMSLVDRVRANYSVDSAYVTAAASACAVPATVCAMAPDDAGPATSCTPQQMATYDLWEISCLNGLNTLPGGGMVVTCSDATCSPSSTMQIIISWQTKSQDAGFTTEDVVVTIVPGEPKA
jgi:type IV pilus assembly protein PilV